MGMLSNFEGVREGREVKQPTGPAADILSANTAMAKQHCATIVKFLTDCLGDHMESANGKRPTIVVETATITSNGEITAILIIDGEKAKYNYTPQQYVAARTFITNQGLMYKNGIVK
jgi:hypothetical protein